MTDAMLQKMTGVKKLFGERGFTSSERRSARPRSRLTALPAAIRAKAAKPSSRRGHGRKITCRLVPDQKPEHVRKAVVAHLKKICPATVRMEIEVGHGAEAYFVSPTGKQAQAALRALEQAFGHKPIVTREGGSIPIVNEFKKILGADSLLLGLGLPDDSAHFAQ